MEILTKIEEKVRRALDKITTLQEENDKLKQMSADYEAKLENLLADLEQVESDETQMTEELQDTETSEATATDESSMEELAQDSESSYNSESEASDSETVGLGGNTSTSYNQFGS